MLLLLCSALDVAAYGAAPSRAGVPCMAVTQRPMTGFARWSSEVAEVPVGNKMRRGQRVAKAAAAVPNIVQAAAVRTALFAGRPLRLVGGALRPKQDDLPVLHDEDAGVSACKTTSCPRLLTRETLRYFLPHNALLTTRSSSAGVHPMGRAGTREWVVAAALMVPVYVEALTGRCLMQARRGRRPRLRGAHDLGMQHSTL
jgi:hypothetical protein